jgi:hypothetical protein
MQRIHRIFLTVVFLLTAIPVAKLCAWIGGGGVAPMMERVSPIEAVAGDTVAVTGFQLDAKHVGELYLSGGAEYYKVSIVTQSDRAITFQVPGDVPPGVLGLAIKLMGGTELIDQPVFLSIIGGPIS